MEKGLLEKTGKPLSHWVKMVTKLKIEKHKTIIDFLKAEHGFTYGFANYVAHNVLKNDAGSIDNTDLLKNQYDRKPELLPLYNLLVKNIKTFGKDIEFVPKKANVSVKTKKQFALIQPSTKTRIDIGLKLRTTPVGGRLLDSGSFGTMCTHRIQVTCKDDIDKGLFDWIKKSYKESL